MYTKILNFKLELLIYIIRLPNAINILINVYHISLLSFKYKVLLELCLDILNLD